MLTAARHRRPKPAWQRRLGIALVAVLCLALLTVGTVLVASYRLADQIQTDDAFGDIVGPRPQQFVDPDGGKPVNILVLGEDSREGQSYVKGSTSGLSDTTILLHVSADRERAYGVSIPRDLMVDRPACKDDATGETDPGASTVTWNEAFALGGAGCTVAQFEHMSGILVNHFLVLRFQAVKDIADALDGVPVCVPQTIDDPANQIYLPEGRYDAKGNVAVSYVRARYEIGSGSDVGRMKRQQVFLASMVRKATSTGTLVNPLRLYRTVDAATRSFVADPELGNVTNLVGLARTLRGIGLDNVQFLTMPIAPFSPDPNRLAAGPGAQQLWAELRRDEELDARFTRDATSAARGAPRAGSVATTDPADQGLCS